MAKSLRGQVLVSAKHLRDPNFYKTVVLMVEHGTDGAMGIVINRPSSILVTHALAGHFQLPECTDLVYCGGPVEPAGLIILHDAPDVEERQLEVVEGLYLGCSAEAFEEVVRRSQGEEQSIRFRVFSGCAGWSPDQLEGELERGDWFVHPATQELVFDEDPYELYETMLGRVSESHQLLPRAEGNPAWN